MKTTLDIPDALAGEVQRRASRDGRALVDQIVRLVELGLLASDVPAAEFERFVRSARSDHAAAPSAPHNGSNLPMYSDPATGLPVIDSPPDAPVHTMNLDEVMALARRAQSEDDLERAGLPVRH